MHCKVYTHTDINNDTYSKQTEYVRLRLNEYNITIRLLYTIETTVRFLPLPLSASFVTSIKDRRREKQVKKLTNCLAHFLSLSQTFTNLNECQPYLFRHRLHALRKQRLRVHRLPRLRRDRMHTVRGGRRKGMQTSSSRLSLLWLHARVRHRQRSSRRRSRIN